ncbi:MAG: sugar phosphate isomerase/epimerase [Ruminococcaceae bacterium]|nr:sugar phosphate isomerase/epimerase [Oscillospiraceae bacterium]
MKVGLLVDITENYKENIRQAKALGFDCGQICIWNMDFYTKDNLNELKAILKKEEFAVSAVWCGWRAPVVWSHPQKYSTLGLVPDYLRAVRMEDLRRGARFAYDLGVSTIITHTGFIPDDPYHPTHIAIANELKAFCKELDERGQRFAFETGEELPLTLSILINEIGLDNVGVNFDPANFISGGRGNPNEAMELLGSRIFGMHAKDAIPPKFGEVGGKQTQIGEGSVNFRRLIEQLKEFGYAGDIVIEHEMEGRADRNADIAKSKIYLENIISEVYGK